MGLLILLLQLSVGMVEAAQRPMVKGTGVDPESVIPSSSIMGSNGVAGSGWGRGLKLTNANTIGIEGRITYVLPGPNYQTKPLDDRTELILRIEKIEPVDAANAAGSNRYYFHFIGLEPGSYLLANFLVRPDGSRPDEIGDTRLDVRAMLPEEHNGQLNIYVPRRFPFIGGYRVLLGALAFLWIGGLVAFAVAGRKRKGPVEAVVAVPEPTLAERLQPLIEAAARGPLTIEQQANLERLLMGYWREKLSLPDMRMAEALGKLKAHTEAGAILRAIERWLHRPVEQSAPGAGSNAGVSASEIAALLKPYRIVPTTTAAAAGGAA